MNKRTLAVWMTWLSLLLAVAGCARTTPTAGPELDASVSPHRYGMLPEALGCNYVGSFGIECQRASDSQNIPNNVATPVVMYGAPLVPLQNGWSARYDGTVHLRTQSCDGGPWCDCDIHRLFPGTLWNGTFTRADGVASDILVDSYCGFAASAQISVNTQGIPSLLATCSPACVARGRLNASITLAPFDAGIFDAGDAGDASTPFAPFQVNQIVETGQSLAEGHLATYQSPTTTRYANLAINDSSHTYNITLPAAATLSLAAAAGPYRPGMSTALAYPNNQDGQVASFQMMDQLTLDSPSTSMVQIGTNVGQDGQTFSVIGKGGSGNAYAAGVYEVTAAHNLTAPGSTYGGAGGKSHGVTALLLTHGEADAQGTSVIQYNADIWTMLTNAQADYAAVTGQSFQFPEILSSQSSSPTIGFGVPTTEKSQWQTAYRSLGQSILLAGPKYQYAYADGSPGLHISGPAQVLLGELYAEAWDAWRLTGSWQPVWPTSIAASQSSTAVTISFNVPAGPLVFDGANSPPHQSGTNFSAWAAGKGLEFYDTILGGLVNGEPAQGFVSNVTNAAPPVFTTSINHPYNTGDIITIQNIAMGTTGAEGVVNGTFTITKVSANSFSLNGVGAPGSTFSAPSNGSLIYKPITISTAAISGANVNVTLARTPAADATIGYAMTADLTTIGGSTGGFGSTGGNSYGRCGLIRDSSSATGISGIAQPNWAVPFQIELFPPTPTVAGIVPANGPTTGNTQVTVYGTGLTNVMSISVDGVPLKSFYALNDDVAIGMTAAGTTGTGPVVVADITGQSANLANGWSYSAAPEITSIGSSVSVPSGGTKLQIQGLGFTNSSVVKVNGNAVTGFSQAGGTTINCTVPAGVASGTPVQVTVQDVGGTTNSGWGSRFWYLPASIAWQVQVTPETWNAGTGTLTDPTGAFTWTPGAFTAPVLATQQTLLGTEPFLQFTAVSNEALTGNPPAVSGTGPYALVMIGYSTTTGASDFCGDNNPTLGFFSSQLFFNTGNLLGVASTPASVTGNGACMVGLSGSSTGEVIVDGNVLATGNSGTTSSGNVRIGHGGQGYLNGGIAYVAAMLNPSGGDLAIMHTFSQNYALTP